MKKNKRKFIRTRVIPYFLCLIAIITLIVFGTKDKTKSNSLNMNQFASNDFSSVSVDELSEFYIVASVADSIQLSSVDLVSSNYVAASVMYEAGQVSKDKVDKQVIVDTSQLTRCGLFEYIVKDGETMEEIAEKFNLTADQIRWSNGLKKTTDISDGNTLKLPGTPGIIYKVKADETIDSIAEKYGSTSQEIIICNDLENNQKLSKDQLIVLPGGKLPETERPEYVPPAPRRTYTTYIYSGSSNSRQNMRVIASGFYDRSYSYPSVDPGVPGQCTWYAWYMRATDSRSLGRLPGGALGNARAWASTLAGRGYRVDHTPEAGAVFQTTGGSYYGHVGYVMSVNGDGSITVREMNYTRTYQVVESEIPASLVGNFNYIH